MKAFTINEMENIFEIGRAMQHVVDFEEGCVIEDSKNAFLFAAKLAIEFEEKHPDTEDYYSDLDDFITGKILKELKKED
jgi:hypothetical protein